MFMVLLLLECLCTFIATIVGRGNDAPLLLNRGDDNCKRGIDIN